VTVGMTINVLAYKLLWRKGVSPRERFIYGLWVRGWGVWMAVLIPFVMAAVAVWSTFSVQLFLFDALVFVVLGTGVWLFVGYGCGWVLARLFGIPASESSTPACDA
jgi:predicted Na+-dependent transporter